MILSEIGPHIQVAIYIVIIVLGLSLVAAVHKKLTYWPVIRILACIEVGRSVYFGYGDMIRISGVSSDWIAFRQAPYSLIILGAVAALLGYCNWLVRQQNKLDNKGEIKLNGDIRKKTAHEMKGEVEELARAGTEVALEEHAEKLKQQNLETLRRHPRPEKKVGV